MPLTKNIETTDGVTHPEAYAVLTSFTVNWVPKNARVVVQIYHSKASYDNKKDPIWTYNYNILANAQPAKNWPAFDDMFKWDDFLPTMWGSIKAFPEWEGWVEA